ncbi:response regulator [Pseudobacteriovorax antillogorgiicola]|nr:response regulator [Pseudobacteriovorax antillogorgiicola]
MTDLMINLENFPEIIGKEFASSTGPVVVVDDDPQQRQILGACYRKSNCSRDIIFFKSGEEFLDWAGHASTSKESMPSILLLDINMPELDGFEVLQLLRQEASSIHLPNVVMLTTSSFQDDIDRAKGLGANGFWPKPMAIKDYITFFNTLNLATVAIATDS